MSRAIFRSAARSVLLAALVAAGCEKEPVKPPAPPPAPPPAAPAPAASAVTPDAGRPKPKMVANPDGLSLAERIAKRQADEKKLAAELAAAEKARLIKYDKTKLPVHLQVSAAIKKVRAQYDALEPKVAGASDKAKARVQIEKLAGSLKGQIDAASKKMATIDPKGGNSNVTTDYDVMLNALAVDYPAALVTALDGEGRPLAEQKADLDKRTKKIDGWLDEVKKAKK